MKMTNSTNEKSSPESRCPFTALNHEMLISRARALSTALHNERRRKSHWYQAYIRARREKKCQMSKQFNKIFTADHLDRLITESTKLGELNEKSVLFYLLQDTLRSLQQNLRQ